jgi:hypothetical protein
MAAGAATVAISSAGVVASARLRDAVVEMNVALAAIVVPGKAAPVVALF